MLSNNVLLCIVTSFYFLQAKETELLGLNKVVNEAKSKVCMSRTT